MSPENFVYWLKGYLEMAQPTTLNEQQVKMIEDHINLVLKKVTPTYSYPTNVGQQLIVGGKPDLSKIMPASDGTALIC